MTDILLVAANVAAIIAGFLTAVGLAYLIMKLIIQAFRPNKDREQ